MTLERPYNFAGGPGCLPAKVLLEAQGELMNWQGHGMSIMEMSHRSKEFTNVFENLCSTLTELLHIPASHQLLIMHGGGSQQFSAVPLNLLGSSAGLADYAITGLWSGKAFEEAKKYCSPSIACNAEEYHNIPPVESWTLKKGASYLHYCSNETVNGLQFSKPPDIDTPLVSDMSSDFCTRPIDFHRHALIYAGVQKSIGPPAGAVVIVRKDLCENPQKICPSTSSYKVALKSNSLSNTPPCWTIYIMGLVAKYIKQKGGIPAIQEETATKAALIYGEIQKGKNFYLSPCHDVACRSLTTIPFRVKSDQGMEKKFLAEASSQGLLNLEGHRSVGGCRAALYLGMPLAGAQKLADFMKDFREAHE